MIQPLCRMGHPVLRKVAKKLSLDEIRDPAFKDFLQDMVDSMIHHGGIGLAAPQIGSSVQVAVIELPAGSNRYGSKDSLPRTFFINPEIEVLDHTTQGFWEGCLSVPGLRGHVERPRKVRVTYLNEEGQENEIVAEGFLATVLQHELDHLKGQLYIDLLSDTRLLSFQEEFQQFYGQAPNLDESDV